MSSLARRRHGVILLLLAVISAPLAMAQWDPNSPTLPNLQINIQALLTALITYLAPIMGACITAGLAFFAIRKGLRWLRGAFR